MWHVIRSPGGYAIIHPKNPRCFFQVNPELNPGVDLYLQIQEGQTSTAKKRVFFYRSSSTPSPEFDDFWKM